MMTMYTYDVLIEKFAKGSKVRAVLFDVYEDGAKSVSEIAETDLDDVYDLKAAERWMRSMLASIVEDREAFRKAWKVRRVMDLDAPKPVAVEPKNDLNPLIEEVYKAVTLSPLRREDILTVLDVVKNKVMAIPVKKVEEE